MEPIHEYSGREQSYVKHVFLKRYLEALAHKTASTFSHIAYVDGFAGPWQSANEKFQDTSFSIALTALRGAKASWKARRDVRMSAFLVERDQTAYSQLAQVPKLFPDISIKTYPRDFLSALPTILSDIPSDAFTFFFIDPKGWRIPLRNLEKMLARPNSEIVFNFMLDFVNRAASISEPAVVAGLDELIPFGDWRTKLKNVESAQSEFIPDRRKTILVEGFSESLARLGRYQYVAETTVLRPVMDRPLYCLFYATRHERGIEVFRDCQIKALMTQSKLRAAVKVERSETLTGQREFFQSLHDMAPDELTSHLESERVAATKTLIELAPKAPQWVLYEKLWPQILARHVVKRADVNQIAVRLRNEGQLHFPEWEKGKRVPQPSYRTQRT